MKTLSLFCPTTHTEGNALNKRELERAQRRLEKQEHELAVRAGLLMFHAGIGKVAAYEIAQSGPSVDGKQLAELVGTFLMSGFREDQIAEWIFEGFERPFVAAVWLRKGYSPGQVRFLLEKMAALPRSEDVVQIASVLRQKYAR